MLVIDNGGRHDEGCIGDLVVGEAFMSGLAGTVCWGTHRDTGAILAMGARVWSLGTCPNGPLELRRRHATALTAANIGSVTVTLDDYVFADDDGVVVVTASDLHRIVQTARDIASRRRRAGRTAAQGRAAAEHSSISTGTWRSATRIRIYTFRDHLKTFGGAIEI